MIGAAIGFWGGLILVIVAIFLFALSAGGVLKLVDQALRIKEKLVKVKEKLDNIMHKLASRSNKYRKRNRLRWQDWAADKFNGFWGGGEEPAPEKAAGPTEAKEAEQQPMDGGKED